MENCAANAHGLVGLATRLSARAVLLALRIYQLVLSALFVFLFGQACRFTPSCSEYARQALTRHGLWHGTGLALRRLLRCRPGGGWGYDPVPFAVPSSRISER